MCSRHLSCHSPHIFHVSFFFYYLSPSTQPNLPVSRWQNDIPSRACVCVWSLWGILDVGHPFGKRICWSGVEKLCLSTNRACVCVCGVQLQTYYSARPLSDSFNSKNRNCWASGNQIIFPGLNPLTLSLSRFCDSSAL